MVLSIAKSLPVSDCVIVLGDCGGRIKGVSIIGNGKTDRERSGRFIGGGVEGS